MTLRLTLDEARWREHVQRVAGAVDGLVPVVKGNGYGFGREWLAGEAAKLAEHVCVGTIDELQGLPDTVTPIVLTPTRRPPSVAAVLTVGSRSDVAALDGWRGAVIIKLQSSMRRFGVAPDELDPLLACARAAGLETIAAALHLPLAGDDAARAAEVEAWLAHLEPALALWLSHLDPPAFAALQRAHPDRELRLRLGSALWHGAKPFLALHADVLAVHDVCAGERVGYRATEVAVDGTLVIAGAGTAHGIAPLASGQSPFHFARRRLALVEPPHMHSSMVLVPASDPAPAVGDWVDVQRPLIDVAPDTIEWT